MTSRALELVKVLAEYSHKSKGFSQVMQKVTLISAGDGQCKAEYTVAEEHLNPLGTLHGGYISTLIDCISSYAQMAQGAPHEVILSPGGVSVDLHVTFLKAAYPGEVITIDAKTIKSGRTLAFLEVELSKKANGAIVARGQHTKFLGGR